jgi:lauroyl/myristoyl acyltransferase
LFAHGPVEAPLVGSSDVPTRHHLDLLTVVMLLETVRRSRSRRLADGAARALGALAYRVSRDKRRRMERYVDDGLGPLPPAARARIVRGSFFTFWDETLAFVPRIGTRAPTAELVGREHLEAARAAGRGAILWESGALGRRNVAKQVLARDGFPVHQVHSELHRAGFVGDRSPSWLRDRVVLPYFETRERAFVADVVTLSHAASIAVVRTLLGVLRRNGIVCITADAAFGERLVTVPLLGTPKRFATGMVTLARTSGAALLPLFCVREDDGRIRVVVEPPVPTPPTGDRDAVRDAAIRRYAAMLDSYLRRHPDQYRSWHYPWWTLE